MTTIEKASVPTLDDIRIRAGFDPQFRARLIADPRGTLVAEGVDVPEGLTVSVVEPTRPDEFVLDLPPVLQQDDDAELTEDALSGASGGISPWALVIPIAFVLGVESKKWF
ncbi:hypothetical protein GIS00_08495 [Nakamurella sp. YIM 132087]|uniref:NHLP leader peptide family natural product n=1 Tax=Nakamurella alba TaxID=2665158 RepID=A0A7K1FIN0_9ACTN|nr:hypothetical protein [Nakamurella alba]MTD13981.1 hypothetical protein [Nakamurella alba]